MNTVRLSKGVIFFDNFDQPTLSDKWTVIPNDDVRYSLSERSGYISVYHGTPDFMLLTTEPDQYVLDLKNEYVPSDDVHQAGIIVFRAIEDSLEVLEYYDSTKDASFVYENLRVIKNGTIYTIYGKNASWSDWEIVGSAEFRSAGMVGIIVKGPSSDTDPTFYADYIKIYTSQEIQFINVPLGYKVEMYRDTGTLISAKRVVDSYKGIKFDLLEVPPVNGYFKVYDETNQLIHTSSTFDICGGDIYYYGATLNVSVNDVEIHQDTECFLGYFTDSLISFQVIINNPHDIAFNNVELSRLQYGTDIGYSFVQFCLTSDGTYTDSINLGIVNPQESVTVYAKITRDPDVIPMDINPFKFNLKITNG